MSRRSFPQLRLIAAGAIGLLAVLTPGHAGAQSAPPNANADMWPTLAPVPPLDAAIERRIDGLLATMTLEEKVGQTVQADIASIQPDDLLRYPLGSILNGGDASPGGKPRAEPEEWLALADAFFAANRARGGTYVPLIWGIDAVHGHNKIVGATVFPHNIGLGAARNPELIRRIGTATALEVSVTGQEWTFAPTLAVVRDDHWGRTYESYSEDPAIVAAYAGAMVEGLQGKPGAPDFLRAGHVIATAKHFIGDGGTDKGIDQGDNLANETALRDIHGAGYVPALEAGVQTVMASYSSWHGRKMHGNASLLTGVLKQRMGFEGFVIGDWNGHAQVNGCTPGNCPQAMLAGVDMYMAPENWRELFDNLLAQVRSGTIPAARLDDAVRRILRVKLRAGLFEAPRPSQRPFAGKFDLLGTPAHRALAREAARESLVLLKNEGGLLPLAPRSRVLVAGDGADDIGRQCGGWTLSWQGVTGDNAGFPHGQSIYAGIAEAVSAAGGAAALSPDGSFTQKPDIAIVVFGEMPYAEMKGDLPTTSYSAARPGDLALIEKLSGDGIPVVAVFLSGRPLWSTPEINASRAFVAAWLPGTEGGAVADLLFRTPGGAIAHDFRGRLSFSWPRRPNQQVNAGDTPYEPLFPLGYGLDYATSADLGRLPTE
ncbi:glycoside hydrolase family 3 protein [Ancylobacter terrae]|uniref:glycoside hydrolase family 3 protein n=1 Tax=Ancylobacter sp. sgz301288 TaxID=3342077 RepID=UPI00385D4DB4